MSKNQAKIGLTYNLLLSHLKLGSVFLGWAAQSQCRHFNVYIKTFFLTPGQTCSKSHQKKGDPYD